MAWFEAFSEEACAQLDSISRFVYVQEPAPSATDEQLLAICQAVNAAGPERGRAFAEQLNEHRRVIIGMFGSRAPTLVLGPDRADEERQELLACGLVAEALANLGYPDFRDVLVGLALHHECARRLKLDPSEVFDDAARYADEETAALMRIFGRRRDVTLQRFGWREIPTPGGPRFEPV
ncbi:MAG: hypothetical protein QOE92_1459 [Chloroflexota bacterium]|nr:hypothetical protein [Chloroflexota bacterium]